MLVTIGSFDGFHKGHAELFRLCKNNAQNDDWAVISFNPHPSEFMHKLNHSLFTLREKELIRRIFDIPNMYFLDFDEAFKNLSPAEFWNLLRERFNVDGLIMGRDFHFGINHSGSAEYLCELAEHDGIKKIMIADLLYKSKYSSSKVRENISYGNIDNAREILGYPYFMMSKIISGNQRGRTMNFPTANLDIHNRFIPLDGVYCCAVLVDNEYHCGALSIGNNPTFHDVKETRCEVNILDFDGDIYGDEIIIFFLARLRDMHEFHDKTQLMTQIKNDIETCRKLYEAKMIDNKNFLERAKMIYNEDRDLKSEIIRLV